MANDSYVIMLEYGELLEIFFSKKVRSWQLKYLAGKSVKLIGAEHEVRDDDYSFTILDELESSNSNEENLFDSSNNYFENKEELLFNELEMLQKTCNFSEDDMFSIHKHDLKLEHVIDIDEIKLREKNYSKQMRSVWDKINAVKKMSELGSMRDFLISLLKFLLVEKIPWVSALEKYSSINKKNNLLVERIIEIFNEVSIRYEIKSHEFCAVTRLPKSFEFPWKPVLVRIFIEFLRNGGEGYFGFCEYCDNFFTVQRKGRKKFCSDICRVNASKAKAGD